MFTLCFNLCLIAILGKILQPYYIPFTVEVNPSKQLLYVLEHPLNYLSMFFIRFPFDLPMLFESAIGVLGWMDVFLSYKIYFFYLAAIIIIPRNDCGELEIPKIRNFLIPFLIFCIVFGFYLIQYMSWNPYQNTTIEGGQQGRYYLPILPVFFLIFYKQRHGLNKFLKFFLCLGIFMSLASSTTIIIKEFYLK